MTGGILARMYAFNQAISYPPSLHISKTIDNKIALDFCCPRLPVKDESKKKGFKLYYNEETPSK